MSGKDPIVISAKRCGSTIVQDIAYYMLHKEKGNLNKIHSFKNAKDFLELCSPKAIITIRDPMWMLLSLYRTSYLNSNLVPDGSITREAYLKFRKHNSWELMQSLSVLSDSYGNYINLMNCECDYCIEKRGTILMIEYEKYIESDLGNYHNLCSALSDFLNIDLDTELVSKINERFNYKRIKKETDDLKTFKKKTDMGYHGYHIGDTDTSGWEAKFTKKCLEIVKEDLIRDELFRPIMNKYHKGIVEEC